MKNLHLYKPRTIRGSSHLLSVSSSQVLWNSSGCCTILAVMNLMISLACVITFCCCTALAGPLFPYGPAAYAAYAKGYYTPLLPGPGPLPAAPALPARLAAPVAAPVSPAAAFPGVPAAYYNYPATASFNYLGYPYDYPYYSYPYGGYVAPYKK